MSSEQRAGPAPAFFDYDLPPQLIAQEPCAERDASRLMIVHRADASIGHGIFRQLPDLLNPGDLLVLNDTRVLPARLYGRRSRTGGKWEGLFLRGLTDGFWEILCQTRGRLTEGERVVVDEGRLELELIRKTAEAHWLVKPSDARSPVDILSAHGHVPIPPYIRKGIDNQTDRERYQTVFAQQPGAVAAPTAGLHFTPRLFETLKDRHIEWTFVTLHVGVGTFQPIQVEDFRQHRMHREWGELSGGTAEAINRCRKRGGRVVAVGTTSVRLLEAVAASGNIRSWSGETDLFIYPPYEFRAVDVLITNFHLPRSSLLLLAGAFAGVELLERAYKAAIEQAYRFFSYGDAMLIL
jgi:S-adenosylmethionine:tRNA ribosyltransferase-isomerase